MRTDLWVFFTMVYLGVFIHTCFTTECIATKITNKSFSWPFFALVTMTAEFIFISKDFLTVTTFEAFVFHAFHVFDNFCPGKKSGFASGTLIVMVRSKMVNVFINTLHVWGFEIASQAIMWVVQLWVGFIVIVVMLTKIDEQSFSGTFVIRAIIIRASESHSVTFQKMFLKVTEIFHGFVTN